MRWMMLALAIMWHAGAAWAAPGGTSAAGDAAILEEIMSGVEKRYAGEGFEARFRQESTLKAMDITDTAEGSLLIKRPDKMRWEYETPEKQLVITNGDELWIFRPTDNQVMIGSAPEFFRGGKGASFLSDIRRIRRHFMVSLADASEGRDYVLKLVPRDETIDLVSILMRISARDFTVTDVTTTNSFGDETFIALDRYRFNLQPDDDAFLFHIPEGADVVHLAE